MHQASTPNIISSIAYICACIQISVCFQLETNTDQFCINRFVKGNQYSRNPGFNSSATLLPLVSTVRHIRFKPVRNKYSNFIAPANTFNKQKAKLCIQASYILVQNVEASYVSSFLIYWEQFPKTRVPQDSLSWDDS